MWNPNKWNLNSHQNKVTFVIITPYITYCIARWACVDIDMGNEMHTKVSESAQQTISTKVKLRVKLVFLNWLVENELH